MNFKDSDLSYDGVLLLSKELAAKIGLLKLVNKLFKTHDHRTYHKHMDAEPYQFIQFYCSRGKMENFTREGKSGFDFSSVNSRSKAVNTNPLQVYALS